MQTLKKHLNFLSLCMPTQKFIIVTAPSGTGKTTITRYLLQKYPQLTFSVSATTRQPRAGEVNGADYYFISVEDFQHKIQENAFIEWEMVYEGKYYGTLKTELGRIWGEEKVPVLDIDVQGAIHIKQQFPQNSLSIFIEPPSIEELKRRLTNRGTDSLESIETRYKKAEYELSFKSQFDRVIMNDNLEKACHDTEAVIKEFLGWP